MKTGEPASDANPKANRLKRVAVSVRARVSLASRVHERADPENFFRHPIAVNVRQIEQREAGLARRDHRPPSGGFGFGGHFGWVPTARDAPAAVSEATGLERTIAEGDCLHLGILAFRSF